MTLLKLADPTQPGDDAVVLVHGMLSGRRSMRQIADELTSARFQVTNWGYATLTRSIREHADALSNVLLKRLTDPQILRIHLVAHSMGCIIVRLALLRIRLPEGSRVVMLAPPNAGSRLTRLPSGPLASWFPPIAELSEAEDSLVNQLPPPIGIDVGVIAADRDRIVELESTHLANQRDHLVVSATHQRLPMSPAAVLQVHQFLSTGLFRRTEAMVAKAA